MHPYQASQRHISDDIKGTKSDELFQYFRFGRHRLWYDFPVPDGKYRVELYFAEPWHGKGGGEKDDYEGLRIFDVTINGETVIDDLDPWAEAGYLGSMKRVVTAKAKNGRLHISFPEVKAGQAIIAAIAIASKEQDISLTSHPLPLTSLKWRAFDTDTIAKLPKEELPLDVDPRPATVYEPQKVKKGQPTTFIITPGLGQEYAIRFRFKNITGAPVTGHLTITDSKHIVLVDKEITFPTTPNKFKMLSTTTGTQINAGTYTLRIDAKDIEFKNIEIQ